MAASNTSDNAVLRLAVPEYPEELAETTMSVEKAQTTADNARGTEAVDELIATITDDAARSTLAQESTTVAAFASLKVAVIRSAFQNDLLGEHVYPSLSIRVEVHRIGA